MTAAVERLLQMSLAGGVLIVVVLLLRLAARRTPHAVTMALWVLVALRLCCPFVIPLPQSPVSAPVVETPPMLTVPVTVIPYLPETEEATDTLAQDEPPLAGYEPQAPALSIMEIAGCVWVAGMAVMAGSALVSWRRLRRRVSTAVRQTDGSWRCDAINGPFVLGLIRPRVYLPFHVNEADTSYVLAHEQAHIRRRDPLWKCVGFCLLAVHWFNPLVWVAYRLFCRDIEFACDRRVTAAMAEEEKGLYARALLSCATRPRPAIACPLAFGETGVKQRIKAVLSPKKPLLWVTIGALAVGAVATALLLTVSPASFDGISAGDYAGDDGVLLTLAEADNNRYVQSLTIRWQNVASDTLHLADGYADGYAIEQKIDGEWQKLKKRGAENTAYFDLLRTVTIPVGGSSEITYSLSEDFLLLEKGNYRFVCDFTIGEGNDATNGTAILPFTIRKDPRTVEFNEDSEGLTLLPVRLDLTPGAQQITVKLKNNGISAAEFGESFSIERRVDERWMPFSQKENVAFILLARSLHAGGEEEKTYNLTDLYGDLPNGDYRLLVRYENEKHRGGEYATLPFTITGSFDMAADVVSGIVGTLSYSIEGNLTMKATWCNDLPQPVYFGEGFAVERLGEDGWQPLTRTKEAGDEPRSIKIAAYCMREMTYAIGDRYETLLPGEYRLVASYDEPNGTKSIALPFRVSNEVAVQGGLVTWRMTAVDVSEKEQAVAVSVGNGTKHTLYMKDYRLYRMTDKGWKICEPLSDEAAREPRPLASGEHTTETFSLSERFGYLSPGEYRISFYFTCDDEDRLGIIDFTIPA